MAEGWTWGEFKAYLREMDPIAAERLLDAAQAAGVPYMGEKAGDWFDKIIARINRDVVEVSQKAEALFTWNGAAVGIRGLKTKLGETFGRGLRG